MCEPTEPTGAGRAFHRCWPNCASAPQKGQRMSSTTQSPGRKANAAQPLGERAGLVSNEKTKATGEKSRKAAGPDGPDASVVGRPFKSKP